MNASAVQHTRVPALRIAGLVLLASLSSCSLFRHPKPVLDNGPTGAAMVSERVKQRFDHAVSLIQAGKNEQAEGELRDVILLAPQQPAPYVDLALLYRKQNKLDEAEEILKTAVTHNDGSALVWTQLGVVQRLRGEFKDAESSYEKAIALDPGYAPAYRDLGVVADVYLGDNDRALEAFQHYKELKGESEDKLVANWIAELRVRSGRKEEGRGPTQNASAPSPASRAD